jgi:hypothetical protein
MLSLHTLNFKNGTSTTVYMIIAKTKSIPDGFMSTDQRETNLPAKSQPEIFKCSNNFIRGR